jgi:hypothetical protein
MDQRDRRAMFKAFIPTQEIGLIAVGGKATDGVNLRFDRDHFAKDFDLFGTIHERSP